MSDKKNFRTIAVNAFNKTWDYIDKKDKTPKDIEEMISLAFESKDNWIKAGGTILNEVRSDWMISHVYSLTNNGEKALEYAILCYDKTVKNDINDFDLVFAYEAMAFAHKVLGNAEKSNEYLKQGYESIEQVEKQGDKDYCKSQLDLI